VSIIAFGFSKSIVAAILCLLTDLTCVSTFFLQIFS
jgi:uncharacterized membrane protein